MGGPLIDFGCRVTFLISLKGFALMPNSSIDYYLSQNSPWCYFGAGQLAKIAEKAGRKVNAYPVMGMDVFSKTGGLPLGKRSPERQAYRMAELERWRTFHKLPINIQPKFFPSNDTLASHAVIAAQAQGLDALGLSLELGRALWEMEQDFSQLDVVLQAADRAGIDLDALGDIGGDLGQHADQYKANTEQAIARGVFGFPSYIVDGELFWGQDRLDFLARKLASS
jgi:2-hydroxychromene-2-carboxylate isomerase